jgi:hypothetical protein
MGYRKASPAKYDMKAKDTQNKAQILSKARGRSL